MTTSDEAPLLSVRRLVTTVRVGDRDVAALRDISFDLAAGQALGLVGESGSGKSLTAFSIMRLLDDQRVRVAAGQILLSRDGKGGKAVDLATLDDRSLCRVRGNEVAMVFQEPGTALNPVQTIGDQVGEPLRLHKGFSAKQAFGAAIELLSQVGIPDPAERARAYPHQLSGGMKQRVVIAMALACGPKLLIADEPTTALDVTVQAQILELLTKLRRSHGMALLLITHDLGVVAETCDNVAVMYAGRIVEHGPVAGLFAHAQHPYTHGLLGVLGALDRGTGDRLREIPGTVPALGAFPTGCAFAGRCARAQDRCRQEDPVRINTPGTGHSSACFFPVEAS